MTYVEFLDQNIAENICACITVVPERVVIVGADTKVIYRHIERYKELFANRGYNVEFVARAVNHNKLYAIVELISEIVEAYDDCYFGLTGGGDLFLVAMGIVSERYKHKKLQMHRFNLKNNTVIDCDLDGKTLFEGSLPQLSVVENIRLFGGEVVGCDKKASGTYNWNFDNDFKKDVCDIWEICKGNPKAWNAQIGAFAAIDSVGSNSPDGLSCTVNLSDLEQFYENSNTRSVYKPWIVKSLLSKGLLTAYFEQFGQLYVSFKNHQVKRCLTRAGLALELKITLIAMELREKNGDVVYNDVLNGVYIDWDGEIHTKAGEHDIENEIDVMMMHGIIPVFVSCKNGQIETEELYKLNAVADKFGGSYAKKVIVASALGNSQRDNALRSRAASLGIQIVDRVTERSDAELKRRIMHLWEGNVNQPKS